MQLQHGRRENPLNPSSGREPRVWTTFLLAPGHSVMSQGFLSWTRCSLVGIASRKQPGPSTESMYFIEYWLSVLQFSTELTQLTRRCSHMTH